jgi:hypothetical protein
MGVPPAHFLQEIRVILQELYHEKTPGQAQFLGQLGIQAVAEFGDLLFHVPAEDHLDRPHLDLPGLHRGFQKFRKALPWEATVFTTGAPKRWESLVGFKVMPLRWASSIMFRATTRGVPGS